MIAGDQVTEIFVKQGKDRKTCLLRDQMVSVNLKACGMCGNL